MGVQEGGDRQLESESKDNRALIDNNSAQNLSSEDIDAMRRLVNRWCCSYTDVICLIMTLNVFVATLGSCVMT